MSDPDRGLYRTAFVCAVLVALSWAVFVYGMLVPPPGPFDTLEAYLQQPTTPAQLAYLWGGIFGSLLVIPVFLALYQGYRDEIGTVLSVPVVLGIVGAAMLMLGFMVDSGSSAYQFPITLEGVSGVDDATLLAAEALARDHIEMTWAIGSILSYGLAILWIAILLLRSPRVPRWLSWVGVVAGLAGFVWAIRYLPIPVGNAAAIPILIVNIVLGIVWIVGMAWLLQRDAGPEAPAEA